MECPLIDRKIGKKSQISRRTQQTVRCHNSDHKVGRFVDAEEPPRKAVRSHHQEGPGLAEEETRGTENRREQLKRNRSKMILNFLLGFDH